MEARQSQAAINVDRPLKSKHHFKTESVLNKEPNDFYHLIRWLNNAGLNELLSNVAQPGKRSFLVFSNNRYVNIGTDRIAFFYIKYESPVIRCFDGNEYFVDRSLDELQKLLSGKQFFRINRQYLVNFDAIKEVQYFLARKLLVNLVIPVREKLLVPRLRGSDFLHWLDNR